MVNVINLNPGPVPLTAGTRAAMTGPVISHRSPEFERLYAACRDRLRTVFRTTNDIVIVNGNGNLGLETAICSCLRPHDVVLCLSNGKFGENLRDLTGRHVSDLRVIEVPWGAAFDVDEVAAELDSGVDAVVMTHCETSTGMLNPVREMARMAAEHGALSIVDGVSSIGGVPLPVDEWGIDVAVTASQKCLSAPPGLSVFSVSQRARERVRSNDRTRPYNLDLARYDDAARRNQTPSTAPVPAYRGLDHALAELVDYGLSEYIAAQSRRAEAIRAAGRAMGLEVFPTPNDASAVSDTVTVLELPAPLKAPALVAELLDRGVQISTGIGPLETRTVRLATMSAAITDADVGRALNALRDGLEAITGQPRSDAVEVAERILEVE